MVHYWHKSLFPRFHIVWKSINLHKLPCATCQVREMGYFLRKVSNVLHNPLPISNSFFLEALIEAVKMVFEDLVYDRYWGHPGYPLEQALKKDSESPQAFRTQEFWWSILQPIDEKWVRSRTNRFIASVVCLEELSPSDTNYVWQGLYRVYVTEACFLSHLHIGLSHRMVSVASQPRGEESTVHMPNLKVLKLFSDTRVMPFCRDVLHIIIKYLPHMVRGMLKSIQHDTGRNAPDTKKRKLTTHKFSKSQIQGTVKKQRRQERSMQYHNNHKENETA